MILKKVLAIADDNTTVILWKNHWQMITKGKWFDDQILDHCKDQVDTFSWYADNTLHVDIKEE